MFLTKSWAESISGLDPDSATAWIRTTNIFSYKYSGETFCFFARGLYSLTKLLLCLLWLIQTAQGVSVSRHLLTRRSRLSLGYCGPFCIIFSLLEQVFILSLITICQLLDPVSFFGGPLGFVFICSDLDDIIFSTFNYGRTEPVVSTVPKQNTSFSDPHWFQCGSGPAFGFNEDLDPHWFQWGSGSSFLPRCESGSWKPNPCGSGSWS